MKVLILIAAASLCLTGCHASRNAGTSRAKPAAASSATASTVKAVEKSRNAMLDQSMDLKNEQWTAVPAVASSTATPAKKTVTAPPASSKSAEGAPTVGTNQP